MSIFKRLFGSKHVFTDEERERSFELKQLRQENKRLQLERENELNRVRAEKEKLRLWSEIKELREDENDGNGGSNDFFEKLLPMIMQGNLGGQQQQQNGVVTVQNPVSLLQNPKVMMLLEALENISEDKLKSFLGKLK